VPGYVGYTYVWPLVRGFVGMGAKAKGEEEDDLDPGEASRRPVKMCLGWMYSFPIAALLYFATARLCRRGF
jgi:hypothetical protein